MRLARVATLLFKAMPWWIRAFVYRLKFAGIKMHHSVEIEQNGSFVYRDGCIVGRDANIVIYPNGRLCLSQGVYFGRNVEIGADDMEIGSDTSVQDRCVFLGNIKIGCGCILAPNIFIASGGHHFDLRPHLPIREQDSIGIKSVKHRRVIIEDDCWLGINVVVMPGVVIGKGSVIGAGSVVTKSVPPYSVCVGSPARVVKKRLEFAPMSELSPSNELSLPYYYSGFRYSYDGQVRRIFVCNNEFSLMPDMKEAHKVEILFVNHSIGNIVLLQDGVTHILERGSNAIYCAIDENVFEGGKLLFYVKSKLMSFSDLEIFTVQVIK